MCDVTLAVRLARFFLRGLQMKCPKCQHENTATAKFCEECAAPLPRTCDNCRSQVSLTAKYCPQCGHPLSPVSDDPRFASPKSYTPQHLADKILTSRTALEGERKRSPCCSQILRARWSCLLTATPRTRRSSSILCSNA